MNWNNPIEVITENNDVLTRAQHNGQHCLFYDPAVNIDLIQRLDSPNDICAQANQWLEQKISVSNDFKARLVNINRFAKTLQSIGCVKPMLLFYQGGMPYVAGTGGTRMLALDVLLSISTVPAFISTHTQWRNNFTNLEEVVDIARFKELCGSPNGTVSLRLEDANSDVGINWFEIDNQSTSVAVYSEETTIAALEKYLDEQSAEFKFTPQWFIAPIDWSCYFANNVG